jgi:hypothetical protein
MNSDVERSRPPEQFGYTPRQAQFVLLVTLHGGYFVRRQYVTFTGRTHGQAAVRLIAAAVQRAHVRALPFGRHGHVFHVCARPVYAAIGQEHNRNRRPAEWIAVVRKLMTLDFVLASPQARFWATEEDKVALLSELGVRPDVWPAKRYAPRRPSGPMTTRYFVDKMPWFRLSDDARLWFTYVDAERTLKGFETFVVQYRNLLTAMSAGVVYVGAGAWPGPVEHVFRRTVVRRDSPIAFSDVAFAEYCRLRRDVEAGHLHSLSVEDIRRFRDGRSKFAGPALDELYSRRLHECDVVGSSAIVSERQVTTDCPLRVHRLPFSYGQHQRSHLCPPNIQGDITGD